MTPARERTIGVIVLVMSLAALGVAGYSSLRTRSYVECQADWSQAYATSAAQRAQAADTDRRAVDDMVAAVLSARTAAESRAALLAYQQARADADRRRAANPAPALPDEVCR